MGTSRDSGRRSDGRRFLRGRAAAVTAVLIAALAAASPISAGAMAAVPNLTGSWINPASPSSPPWILKASSGLSTLTGTWTGSGAHSALMGSFTTNVNSTGTAYAGTFHVTELSNVVDGTITFTIVTPNQITVSTQPNPGQNSGGPSTFTLTRAASHSPTIHASFQGHANDVKVVPPLVGPYQLGVSRFRGNITITPQGGGASTITGTITDSNQPRFPQYPANSMTAQVIGYTYHKAPHGAYTKLTLTIQILDTNGARCATGDQGTLTLLQSAHKLSNGQRSDAIGMAWGGRCPQFEQGWINANGGAKTSPSFGGPPNGGQWAIVKISP